MTPRNTITLQDGTPFYITGSNTECRTINNAIFRNLLLQSKEHSKYSQTNPFIIKAATMHYNCNGKNITISEDDEQCIYENSLHFVDPLLKLYYHCPLMLTSNDYMPLMHPNATLACLENVILKQDCEIQSMYVDGIKCPCILADNIIYMECTIHNNPQITLHIKPKSINFTAVLSMSANSTKVTNKSLVIIQMPVRISNTITLHKLQGHCFNNTNIHNTI